MALLNNIDMQKINQFDIKIMAHPSRKEMVEHLLKQLQMPDDIVVWDDREKGGDAIYTAEKAWRSPPTSPDITHRIVLQDDIIVSENFLKICNDIINTIPNNPISLYNNMPDLSSYKNKKCCYLITHMMGGPGIIMPIDYINKCWDWIEVQKNTPNYCVADDAMIERYFKAHDITMYTTIPSIVQHISDKEHKSLITAFGDNVKYFGDRTSGTFRENPQDDFTIFVPPTETLPLKIALAKQKAARILNIESD